VILAVHVGRVDTDLLEGGVDGLLDLLVLGLLDGDGLLGLEHLGGHGGLIDGNRVHGSDLHRDTAGDLGGNLLVEGDDGAELAVEVHVLGHERSLDTGIVSQHVLLTGLAGLVGDVLVEGVTRGGLDGLEGLEVGRELGDGGVGDGRGKGLEIRRSGDEVGLATEAHEDGLSTVHTAQDSTLGGFVVTPLGEGGLTLLAKDLDGTLEIAVGLGEGLLAIHHAGAGHVAQLLDVS